jgi:hypothetical protein
MSDAAGALPETRPEDDEDVVWGLSTAAALWARGEHGDALVWLRRAADAAAAAGQEGRASELVERTTRLERELEHQMRSIMTPPPPPPPPAWNISDETTMPGAHVAARGMELDDGSAGTPARSEPPPPAQFSAALRPPAVPTVPHPTSQLLPPPPSSSPRMPSVSPPPPAVARAPSIAPPAPSAPSSRATRPTPPPPPPTVPRSPTVAPPPPTVPRSPTVAPPPPTVPRSPTMTPPPPVAARKSPPPPAAARKKSAPRAPILDPWADDQTLPGVKLESVLRPIQVQGDQVMVQMRQSVGDGEEDDGVVTSAAPIDTTLKRAAPRPPTPPARKWTATGEQPPGYIADASNIQVKGTPGVRSRPPPVPSSAAPPPATAPAPAAPAPADPPPEVQTSPPAPFDVTNAPTLPSSPSPLARLRAPTVPPPPPSSSSSAPAPSVRSPGPPAPARAAPREPAASVRMPSPGGAPASVGPAKSTPRITPGSAPVPSKAPVSLKAPRSARGSAPVPSKPPVSLPVPSARPSPPRTKLDAAGLDGVEILADLGAEARAGLAAAAVVETLGADEEVAGFGAALLLEGDAAVCAAIVDTPVSRAAPGALLPARGTFADAVALRVVAGARGARIAVWDPGAVGEALGGHPEVLSALSARADRLQALAGATLGPLGELADTARERIVERLSVRVVQPRGMVVEAGAALAELMLVCVGSVEIVGGEATDTVRTGDLLFARAMAEDLPAPAGARAGAAGAILLVGDRGLLPDLAGPPG